MRAARSIAAVDSHTEGMPTRVVVGGVAPIPGATMLERRDHFARELDDLRLLLMREPRGHGAMSGAILQPATRPDADWGVLFIEVSGLLPMCGHGTIGVATVLVETGMVEVREPETVVRLDTPAGLVEARVAVEGGRARSVTLRNVPSFLHARDRPVEVPGLGRVVYDMAFGGNFYALLPASAVGLEVDPARADELIEAGLAIIAAIDAADRPVHPGDARMAGCKHVVLHADGRDGADVPVPHGELAVGDTFVNESVIGTRFTGRVAEETTVAGRPAIVPEITGRAWITGMGQYLLDAEDPFPAGFAL